MGLTASLKKSIYIYPTPNIKCEINIEKKNKKIEIEMPFYIEKTVINFYNDWPIHNWLIKNSGIAEGHKSDVSSEELSNMVNDIQTVLLDNALAPKLFPDYFTNNYDETYFVNLKFSMDKINNLLAECKDNWDFTYESWI
ncbi:MAG: hypothetical protein WC794_06370 [Candidatus Doudnabacteria bacterium]|jgi:hypothetical protein